MRFASELKLEWVHLTVPSIGHRTARFCRSEILRHGVSLLLGSGNAARVFTLTVQGAAGYPYETDISGQTAGQSGDDRFRNLLERFEYGLEYANQRWCSAGYGRFVTADKSARSVDVGNPQSWNRYWYAAGDPVNVNDPSGNDSTCGPGMVWHGEGCTIGEAGTTAQFCLDYPELCNSGSPPVNQCSAGGDSFEGGPNPDPGCILPPRPPAVVTSALSREIDLYDQAAIFPHDPARHTIVGPLPLNRDYFSGFSQAECDKVVAIDSYYVSYRQNKYHYFRPYNSNAYSYTLFSVAGIRLNRWIDLRLELIAPGWGTIIGAIFSPGF